MNKEHTLARAKDLWERFDVPVDGNDCIEQPWMHFAAGTHREEVWHWFESEYGVSVGEDLMGQESELAWEGLTFRLTDNFIRPAYHIWNIPMPDGYVPLCRLKQVQPFSGGREVDTETLFAIRTDGARAILAAQGAGPESSSEMRDYIMERKNSANEWEQKKIRRMRVAIPFLETIENNRRKT